MKKIDYILANFGGPRNLLEVEPFLKELLCDQDVVYTRLPSFIHRLIFRKIAKKRTLKVSHDYELIGGKSPIYQDTENLAALLSKKLNAKFHSFHRYLPQTHSAFIEKIEKSTAEKIVIFPCFPQYCSATTGSILKFFSKKLSKKTQNKFQLIKSYPSDNHFVIPFQSLIKEYLAKQNLSEESTMLLFSAHGIPQSFVQRGDCYQTECEKSFDLIKKGFPQAESLLCYQSKFGPGQWLMPYTVDVCRDIATFSPFRKNIVFIPLSFISDHIETLFEIEKLYLPLIKRKNYQAFRCPALNLHDDWVSGIANMLEPFAT